MAALAGAGASLALLPRAAGAAVDPATDAVTYGPAPSGGDDTAALQAALQAAMPAGGVLLLRPGTYRLDGRLSVYNGHDVRGAGGGFSRAATVLSCTGPDAGIEFSGGGGRSGGFQVEANGVATAPLRRIGGVGRMFADITVTHSAEDGIVCLAAQNDVWTSVVSSDHARDGLVLDQGYGGSHFSRCESQGARRFNLRLDTLVPGGPYPMPSDLVFEQCILETNTVIGTSLARLNGGYDVKFAHTAFWTTGAMPAPLIDVTAGASRIHLADALIGSGADTPTDVGLRVDNACHVELSGSTRFNALGTGIWLCAGTPGVDVHGGQLYDNCVQRYGGPNAAQAASWVMTPFTEPIVSRRLSPGDMAYSSASADGTGFHTFEAASGRKVWGNGQDFVGDVALGRRQAGVLGVDRGQLLATGFGTTAQRPSVTTAAAGSIRLNLDTRQLEVTDGSRWFAPSLRGQVFTASTTLAVPATATVLRVKAVGAGGGGGGGGSVGALSLAAGTFGGSGGGAGMVIETLIAVTPGDTVTITVGRGGTGGRGGAPSLTTVGAAGGNGAAGGATTITASNGTVLVSAPGGGGGPGSPGASASGPGHPTAAGAFGCSDVVAVNGLPGCGAFGRANAIPAPHGVCGGAAGGHSTATRGGGGGVGVALPGGRATFTTSLTSSANGAAGASPQAPGCGGNGGGAAARGGRGGVGGAGASGLVEVFWTG